MGIVNDLELEQEINRLNKVPKVITPQLINPESGRGKGNIQVPESLRKIIGETNVLDGRQEALTIAKEFGVSPSSVSAYANGANSTASYRNPTDIKSFIDKSRKRIQNKARSKLFMALEQITEEKLAEAKLRDVSGVARDMSSIIRDTEPKTENGISINGSKVIVYRPRMREEEDYETIAVNE